MIEAHLNFFSFERNIFIEAEKFLFSFFQINQLKKLLLKGLQLRQVFWHLVVIKMIWKNFS